MKFGISALFFSDNLCQLTSLIYSTSVKKKHFRFFSIIAICLNYVQTVVIFWNVCIIRKLGK